MVLAHEPLTHALVDAVAVAHSSQSTTKTTTTYEVEESVLVAEQRSRLSSLVSQLNVDAHTRPTTLFAHDRSIHKCWMRSRHPLSLSHLAGALGGEQRATTQHPCALTAKITANV
jgi:hypothetical protein